MALTLASLWWLHGAARRLLSCCPACHRYKDKRYAMQTWEDSPTIENYRSHPFLAALESGAAADGGASEIRAHCLSTSNGFQSPARPPALAARPHRGPSTGLPPQRCAVPHTGLHGGSHVPYAFLWRTCQPMGYLKMFIPLPAFLDHANWNTISLVP